MKTQPSTLPLDRALTAEEFEFVSWLLSNGGERAREFLPQLKSAWVVGKCGCGCASINFSVGGVSHYGKGAGMESLCTYRWQEPNGGEFEVYAFACNNLLAGIDLWAATSYGVAATLPDTSALYPV
jgi:hypothetical protein